MENNQETQAQEKEFYTIKEVTKILGVSVSTVRRLIKANTIKFYFFGGKYRFLKTDLQEFLESHKKA